MLTNMGGTPPPVFEMMAMSAQLRNVSAKAVETSRRLSTGRTELTRLATADSLGAIGAGAPHVGRVVGPLEDALGAGDIGRQPDPIPKDVLLLGVARYEESMLPTARNEERIAIEALLGGLLPRIVVGAQIHLEAAIVIGRQLHLHVDLLASCIVTGYNALGILPAGLVRTRRLHMIRIAADAAASAVLLPLHRIAAAEELVVVVVNRIGIAEAPHGIPCRRIH